MMHLFHTVSQECSRITTERYSTSFSSAIKLLHRDLRKPIYNIYGFVRFADEIVDTFHEHDKQSLLAEFRSETFIAIGRGISINPILQSFQLTVNQYGIDHNLIHAFFNSMEMDLGKTKYDTAGYEEYIYGSAEVVGLMCLYIFCEGNRQLFEQLKPAAQSLGAAFQKVNFLRDLKADYKELNRTYFPEVDFKNFTADTKAQIEKDIAADFHAAYKGIGQLPIKARFGVYVAYKYYMSLFKKIKRTEPSALLSCRIRIPNYSKAFIVVRAGLRRQFNIL
ncbi:phytoene/squalene synthase family protein [Ferruginibacter sp. HRS2-29]|uniref:phytoene/squalene synthase family protein n=1 Tax=Ferruginibacter sp. HRS2-29 TaxID=2487334 RepID=UPI0020CF62AD|nr:phytoene/squalene synthase family protein [Ferruginibacter sp. HRS2-29]MCP9749943.1 phytoene/squalene synthase family protein [Ferruginibacter sp. HRS2-29]